MDTCQANIDKLFLRQKAISYCNNCMHVWNIIALRCVASCCVVLCVRECLPAGYTVARSDGQRPQSNYKIISRHIRSAARHGYVRAQRPTIRHSPYVPAVICRTFSPGATPVGEQSAITGPGRHRFTHMHAHRCKHMHAAPSQREGVQTAPKRGVACRGRRGRWAGRRPSRAAPPAESLRGRQRGCEVVCERGLL